MDPAIRDKIDKAVEILRGAGASRVYLFGSAADDGAMVGRLPHDIDLAVEGLPPEVFFGVVGLLLCELRFPVDLIDLDSGTPFVRRLRESGGLRRVA